jgi:hypothetical protein
VKTGKCVDLPGGGNGSVGAQATPYTCNGSSSDNQLWDLVVNQKGAGPSGSDLFALRPHRRVRNHAAKLFSAGSGLRRPMPTRKWSAGVSVSSER